MKLNNFTKEIVKKEAVKKMTIEEKYLDLKRQTEEAGMEIIEKDGKLIVSRKRKINKSTY
jgi:hypothetical protein